MNTAETKNKYTFGFCGSPNCVEIWNCGDLHMAYKLCYRWRLWKIGFSD